MITAVQSSAGSGQPRTLRAEQKWTNCGAAAADEAGRGLSTLLFSSGRCVSDILANMPQAWQQTGLAGWQGKRQCKKKLSAGHTWTWKLGTAVNNNTVKKARWLLWSLTDGELDGYTDEVGSADGNCGGLCASVLLASAFGPAGSNMRLQTDPAPVRFSDSVGGKVLSVNDRLTCVAATHSHFIFNLFT